MDIAELIRNLCKRPGMYVIPPGYATVCAYLQGFDDARNGGPLAGLREWLVVRANGFNNMHWPGIIEATLLPGEAGGSSLTAEQDAACLDGLGLILDEFLQFRREQGLTVIHYRYARWLLGKRWYRGPLRPNPGGTD